MQYKIASAVLLLIAVSVQAVAQFPIPDANFRAKLTSINPGLISGNNLNISAAQSFTADLILSNANISDLSGLQ